MTYIENTCDDDQDDQNKDFNNMVEDLGEEIHRLEQLRK